jgi:hypothetical protein
MNMRIPPQGIPWQAVNSAGGSHVGFSRAAPGTGKLSLARQQSPLDALSELEQWRVKAEDTGKDSARWSLSQCPLTVWVAPYPDSDDLKAFAGPELLFSAMRQWEVVTQGALSFRLLSGSEPHLDLSPDAAAGEADISILWDSQTTLGRDYELGHSNRQVQGKRIRQATITLITRPLIDARLTLTHRQQRLYTTVLHETGHVLGLEHSEDHRDVMHHRGWQRQFLSENDIQRIRNLYDL